jgi:hypothetical protein
MVNGTYFFESYSWTCWSAVSFATMGIFLLVGLAAVHYYFFKKEISPNKNVLMGFLGISLVWTLVSLVIASLVTTGLNQTCREFEHNEKLRSCGAVFANGFFDGHIVPGPGKNLNIVSSAAGAGWMVFLCWLGLSAYEYHVYRRATVQWWSADTALACDKV